MIDPMENRANNARSTVGQVKAISERRSPRVTTQLEIRAAAGFADAIFGFQHVTSTI